MSRASTIIATLASAGADPRQSGQWVRCRATWRGSSDRDVAVHAGSGAWRDHGGGGEHGRWPALLALLQAGAVEGSTSDRAPTKAKGRTTRPADWWLAQGHRRAELPALGSMTNKTSRERMAARRRRAGAVAEQAQVWAVVGRHLAGRLPGAPFDPLDTLAPRASAMVGHEAGAFRLALPIMGWDAAGGLGLAGAHVTNLAQDADGQIKKGGPRSFTPGAQGGARGGQHVSLRHPSHDVQFAPAPWQGGPLYVVGEGLETTLSAMCATGLDGIMAVDAGRMARLLAAPQLIDALTARQAGLLVFADRDRAGTGRDRGYAGQRAGAALVQQARAIGIPAWLLLPPRAFGDKTDWNDLHRQAGLAGLRGALDAAMLAAEAELAEWTALLEQGQDTQQTRVFSLERVRPAQSEPEPAPLRVPLAEAAAAVRNSIREALRGDDDRPTLVAVDPGVGKSHAVSEFAAGALINQDRQGVLIVTPTNSLAQEAAARAQTLRRHGRSPDPQDLGHCQIHPEIEPFSNAWRSVVAHKCQSCPHGLAAMDQVAPRADGPRGGGDAAPCQHIIHLHQVRQSPTATTSSAGLEGDPGLIKWSPARGESAPRRVVLDDTSSLADHKMVRPDQIGQWARTALWQAAADRASGDKARGERAALLDELAPHLRRLAQAIAGHVGDEQARLEGGDWQDLIRIARDPCIDLLDGTGAEAVHQDSEGRQEIPVRALRDLAGAISRGSAWRRAGLLLFSVPTRQASAIAGGALVLDATPSMAVRDLVAAMGGVVREVRAEQRGLVVTQILDGGHGKTACAAPGSRDREMVAFEAAYQAAIDEHGAENVCSITHKSLAEAIRARHMGPDGAIEPGWDAVGWWGRHNRGQNEWEGRTHLTIWGLPQLSPTAAQRQYEAERSAIREACEKAGVAVPEQWQQPWDGERAPRWGRVPGQDVDLQYNGYANDAIDRWARSWTTGEVVQAIGRLRSTRRPDECLTVEIHAAMPLLQEYGMAVDEVRRGAGRTRSEYHQERRDDQGQRAVVAIRALVHQGRAPSRRAANAALEAMGLPTLRPGAWAELLAEAAGTGQEYGLYECGTTPAPLLDDAAVAAAIGQIAEQAARDGEDAAIVAVRLLADPEGRPAATMLAAAAIVEAAVLAAPGGGGENAPAEGAAA